MDANFHAKVKRSGPDDCWEWQGSTRDGYGRLVRGGRDLWAHRVAFEVVHGAIPAGLFVLHSCDNRRCCNPAHLFVGTRADNVADMIAKGRSVFHEWRGDRAHRRKVTSEQVAQIRAEYAAGGISQRELGERFGIVQQQVSHIVRHVSWAA
jgi:hypothetical protein